MRICGLGDSDAGVEGSSLSLSLALALSLLLALESSISESTGAILRSLSIPAAPLSEDSLSKAYRTWRLVRIRDAEVVGSSAVRSTTALRAAGGLLNSERRLLVWRRSVQRCWVRGWIAGGRAVGSRPRREEEEDRSVGGGGVLGLVEEGWEREVAAEAEVEVEVEMEGKVKVGIALWRGDVGSVWVSG